jgi:MFS family permease
LAFFFRPLGAALFGYVGDRFGRRPTLIGLLPTYATVGVWAPILITLVRCLQGLSAGGEFGGAVSVMTEFAPPGRRGLYGSWQSFTVALGLLVGAAAAATMATLLSPEQLSAWGWRVPFLAAFPLGLVALWLRLMLEETPSFKQVEGQVHPGHGAGSPTAPPAVTKPTGAQTARAIALGIGRMMGWSAAGYTFLAVIPSYLQTMLSATFQQALVATALANLGFALTILPAGAISDRVGRRAVMVTGTALIVVLALPLMNLLQDPSASLLAKAGAVLIAGAAVGLIAGPGPAMLSEMFPTTVRYTGLGLAYALSNAVFSGSAGLIITGLIQSTGDPDVPAYYVIVTCLISTIALLTLRGDAHKRSLRD